MVKYFLSKVSSPHFEILLKDPTKKFSWKFAEIFKTASFT